MRAPRRWISWCLGLCCSWSAGRAHAEEAPVLDAEVFSLHFQETTVTQAHPRFDADYSGENSLATKGEVATSITTTLFGGLRLWRGAEIYLNPELSGGRGFSGATGVAGFPNGETFRVGSAEPVIYLARLFLRQSFDLGGGREIAEADANQLATTYATRRLVLTLGRFSLSDLFDDNAFSHDPRTQFLNWALMSSGAWDYPADTRGYTWGGALEFIARPWAVRTAVVLEPKTANGLDMDTHVAQAHGLVLEGERQFGFGDRPGTIRALVFFNRARMGSYAQALSDTGSPPDITQTRREGRTKFGFAISADQELTPTLGGFARLSWNDGRNETWAFTEIDRSAALGIVQRGALWSRSEDELGLALIANGISSDHRRYLEAGGLGFIIGDGALDYSLEGIAEAYYRLAVTPQIAFTPDYQFIVNPAYNSARGPVHVFGLRMHAEL